MYLQITDEVCTLCRRLFGPMVGTDFSFNSCMSVFSMMYSYLSSMLFLHNLIVFVMS